MYPLYVLTNKETPMNVWIDAECGELQPNGKVKAKLGNGLCFRPGWHCADIPLAAHIGKNINGELMQRSDEVWREVMYSDSINYQDIANKNGTNKNGRIVPVKSYLRYIPVDGFYRYKTNPKRLGPWIITGAIKVVKILTNDEVDSICKSHGFEPQRRVSNYG